MWSVGCSTLAGGREIQVPWWACGAWALTFRVAGQCQCLQHCSEAEYTLSCQEKSKRYSLQSCFTSGASSNDQYHSCLIDCFQGLLEVRILLHWSIRMFQVL